MAFAALTWREQGRTEQSELLVSCEALYRHIANFEWPTITAHDLPAYIGGLTGKWVTAEEIEAAPYSVLRTL